MIQGEVKKIKGVESAEFNLVNSQLKIGGNRQMSRQAIVQTVETLGHKVEEEEKTKQVVLHIEGMD